jgi:hypothetical protein
VINPLKSRKDGINIGSVYCGLDQCHFSVDGVHGSVYCGLDLFWSSVDGEGGNGDHGGHGIRDHRDHRDHREVKQQQSSKLLVLQTLLLQIRP